MIHLIIIDSIVSFNFFFIILSFYVKDRIQNVQIFFIEMYDSFFIIEIVTRSQ